ncbi:MAG: hypothetical protein LBH64_00070, partial [Coriobacteriales bacterium]|nr:hypothetical protein [Coriobacteriales bacterium]
MTEGDGFSKALALLKDPRFAYIRKRADKYPLTLEEFDALPLPEGLSSTQTWELLTALRRLTAVEIPEFFVDACGRRGWYSITRSMLDDLAYIEK